MNDNEYKCAMCKGIFEKEWSDEEAEAELESTFKGTPTEDCELVCDDCYKKFMGSLMPRN